MRYFQRRGVTNYPSVPVRHAERCERCCRRYVLIEAHKAKCKAPERVPFVKKPIEEIDAALALIAWKHGMTLEDLKGPSRSRAATEPRRECYRYLREREGFTVLAIAAHFGRHERTIMGALSGLSEGRKTYMREYMRRRRESRERAA